MTSQVIEWDRSDFKKNRPFGSVATFITAPRVLSETRIKQIIKRYLPKGDIVWGIAEEDYVSGFEGQPQFKTLRVEDLQPWVEKTNKNSKHAIHLLRYPQADIENIISPMNAKNYVFVRGSWQYTFHTQPAYSKLTKRKKAFEFVSPFSDEDEAQRYAERTNVLGIEDPSELISAEEFMRAVGDAARSSYDHSFQTGAILADKKGDDEYAYVDACHNQVVPYETYAMHHGFSREEHLVPSQDLNHYDTVHAETLLLIRNKKFKGISLFINLMPCRTCARAIVASGIEEVFYSLPHSNGYAEDLFKVAGIRTARIAL